MSKNIFQSKTFWFAAFTIALGALEAARSIFPEQGVIIMVIGFVQMALRMFTDKPVHIGERE